MALGALLAAAALAAQTHLGGEGLTCRFRLPVGAPRLTCFREPTKTDRLKNPFSVRRYLRIATGCSCYILAPGILQSVPFLLCSGFKNRRQTESPLACSTVQATVKPWARLTMKKPGFV